MESVTEREEAVVVRGLRPGDLEAVIAVDAAHVGRPREEYFRVKLQQNLAETGIKVSLAAEIDGRLCGFLLARVYYGEFGVTEPVAVLDTPEAVGAWLARLPAGEPVTLEWAGDARPPAPALRGVALFHPAAGGAWLAGGDVILDPAARPGARILHAHAGVEHVVHGEPRVVDLHHESRCDDRQVLLAQRVGDRMEVLLLARVVAVLHQSDATRRRDRRHEHVHRIDVLQAGLEIGQVGGERLLPDIADRPGTGVAGRLRARMRALVEGGKRLGLARRPVAGRGRDLLEAAEPVGDVILEARLGQFAVAHDVDAEFRLLADDADHRLVQLIGQRRPVVGLTRHAREQLRGQRLRPRQASHMRGDDAAPEFVDQGHAAGFH